MPIAYQYATLGVGAVLLTLGVLWLYNRREKRRRHAIELMKLMNTWGLDFFSSIYQDYAIGDYSGLVHKVAQIVTAMRSDEAMVAKLHDVTKKVCTYYAEHDPAKKAEMLKVLQQS